MPPSISIYAPLCSTKTALPCPTSKNVTDSVPSGICSSLCPSVPAVDASPFSCCSAICCSDICPSCKAPPDSAACCLTACPSDAAPHPDSKRSRAAQSATAPLLILFTLYFLFFCFPAVCMFFFLFHKIHARSEILKIPHLIVVSGSAERLFKLHSMIH